MTTDEYGFEMGFVPLTREQKRQTIRAMLKDKPNLTYSEIALEVGCTHQCVSQNARLMKLPKRRGVGIPRWRRRKGGWE